ncbi:MAG: hypothetical protein R3C18_18135 [Planctomycetaceae bacterium]
MPLDIKQAAVANDWAHDRPLTCCRFDRQYRYVFCGAQDAGLHRFQLSDGAKTTFNGGHETWIRALTSTLDGNQMLSGGADGKLAWWDVAAADASAKPIRVIDAHKGWIRCLDTHSGGTLIASAGNDGMVRLWNAADGALVREFKAHDRDIYCVAFHPNGEFVFSGDLMGQLKQWKVETGELVREFDAKELHSYNGGQQVDFGGVRGIAVSPDGKFLAAGGLHKATNPLGAVHEPLVQLFEWESAKLAKSQVADDIKQGVLWRLQYLADGTLMGVDGGGNGGFLIFWNSEGEKDIHRFKLPNLARDMDLSPDGLHVATAHYDKHVRITRLGPA